MGAGIRLFGYLLRFPLCADECLLAENFLDRGFLDLLSPLENEQVAPFGFLCTELACVRLFGFSEWSLRLYSLVCGIASLFVFRHLASRLLTGLPLVLAVGCLAVAKAPIGLSAEVKPYAGDLLMALVVLTLALEWLRRPGQILWLWTLCVVLPMALVFSLPAVFVGGAVSVGLLIPVIHSRNPRAIFAYVALNAILVGAFAAILWLNGCMVSGGNNIRDFMTFPVDWQPIFRVI